MTNEEKLKIVNHYLDKLMHIADNCVEKGSYEVALSALSAYCNIQYQINQVYTDKKAEDLVLEISKELVYVPENFKVEKNTVLFYDGFGFDLRGWAASFAKALSSLSYNVIYIAPLSAKGKIIHIAKEIEKGNGRIEYIDTNHSHLGHIEALNRFFNQYRPNAAFFYTTPNDVAGASVFDAYKGKLLRIQIDLTDHAFWIGVNAFDLTIECRLPGLSNMIYYRGVARKRVVITDCCPYINREHDPEQFPFDIVREDYIFSGGSLYKTLGDENLYYYKIVDYILSKHNYLKFLFAGNGDDHELLKVMKQYPGRVFHIHERGDFIRMFENCIFFLNTYPMFGGLMMRYAAMVGKVPLTLKHGSDHDGLLYEQEKRGIEFDTYEEIIKEADKLILDDEYRKQKEAGLSGAVMTEQAFKENLKSIIEEKRVKNKFSSFENIKKIDTTNFRAEYITRLKVEPMIVETIPTRSNLTLIRYFPVLFVRKIMRRIRK